MHSYQKVLMQLGRQLPCDEVKRLFHGRGRMLLGWEQINIEIYDNILWIMLYQEIDETEFRIFLEDLSQNCRQWRLEHIFIQHRYEKDNRVEHVLGSIERIEKPFVVEEAGLKYWVTLGKNQNTGLFLDMVNGRRWVHQQSRGKRVLNVFAYTCSLGIAAAAGDADFVLNVDMAKAAIKRGQQNLALNDLDLKRCGFFAQDVFKVIKKITHKGPFDLLIADPPSFQSKAFDIRKDYKKLLVKLQPALAKNAQLLLCANSPALDPQFLIDLVHEVWPMAKFVGRVSNPDVLKDIDDNSSLKVMAFTLDG